MPRLDEVDLRNEAAAAGQPIPRPTNPLGDMATRLQAMSAPDQEAFRRWVDPNYRQQTMDRALPPSMVEDRNAYLNAKREARQMQLEQQQRRMAEIEARRQQVQAVMQQINQTLATMFQRQGAAGIEQLQSTGGFVSEEQAKEALLNPKNPGEYRRARAYFDRRKQGVGLMETIQQNPVYQAARTEIPYAGQVASALKGGIEASAPVARVLPQTALIQNLGERLPNVPTASGTGAAFAETSVPTEVWMAALELVPGVGTVPDLIKAAKAGAPEVLAALAKTADNFAEKHPEWAAGLRRLAGEYGGGPAGGPLGLLPEKAPGEAAVEGEVLPTVNAKLTSLMSDAVALTPKQRAAFTQAGRERQAAGVRDALRGSGTTTERAIAARGAQKGKIIPAINPVGDKLTADEITDAFNQIDSAYDAGRLTDFEHPNATSALNLLLYGQRLPGEEKLPLNLMPAERKLLGRVLGPEFEAALPKTAEQLSLFQKVVDIATVPRALMASLDISAPGRQGIMLLPRNPREWANAWFPMFRAMGSEEYYTRRTAEFMADPELVKFREGGLVFTDVGGGKTAEEAFVSRWAEKFPGVRMSERAYSMYLNELRAAVGKKQLRYLEKAGKVTDENIAQTAGWINHFSGQGDLRAAAEYTPALNALFFSPKFLVSRPQAVWDLVKPGVSKEVRWQTAQNLGAFVGAGVASLATIKATGVADVEMDPRSSDFGKIKIGNTRIDFWGGFQPIARMVVQASTGQRKSGTVTEDVSRGGVIKRFFRGKLSPTAGIVWDAVVEEGRNYQGDMTNWKGKPFGDDGGLSDTAVRLVTPLFIQGAIDGYRAGGAKGAGLSLAGGTGLGVTSYEPSETSKKKEAKSAAAKAIEKLGARVVESKPWPEQLDKDWQGSAWNALFKREFPELGIDLSKYESKEAAKKAYVDYWWEKKGLNGAPSEAERRDMIGRVFDKSEFAQKWSDNVSLERLAWLRKLTPAQLAEVRKTYQLTETEKKALGIR